jgi:hypothetical protein
MLILVYTHTVICEVYYVKYSCFRGSLTILFVADSKGLTGVSWKQVTPFASGMGLSRRDG